MPTASFGKTFSTPKIARAVFDALVPETDNTHEKRAKTSIRVKNSRVEFTVKGSDPSATRASRDTYGRLADYLKTL